MQQVSRVTARRSGRKRRWTTAIALAWVAAYLLLFYVAPTQSGGVRATAIWQILVDAAAPSVSGPVDAPAGLGSLTQRLWLASVTLGLLTTAIGWGYLVLRALRVSTRLTSLEQILFSYAAGTAVVSLSTLLAGVSGLMQRPTCLILAAAGPAGAGVMLLRRAPGRRFGARPPAAREALWLLPALMPVGVIFAGAMLPPDGGHQYFDIKEYHLEAPKEYFLQGRITLLEHNVYASMPLGTEMLSLLGMIVTGDWWWGALAGQTFLATFAPATAALLFVAGRRFFGAAAGAIAALLYLGTPAIFEVSSTAYVEGALCFYLAAAVYAFGIARSAAEVAGQAGDARRASATGGLFFLAGLLAGAAAACKYPGAVYVVLPLGIACALPSGARSIGISRTRATVLFLGGASATFGPWLARNVIETGNPVYPLLWSVFGGRGWSAAQDARWWHVHGPPGFTWRDLGAGIWQVGVGGAARSPLNPLLLCWAPLALLEPASRRGAARLGGYVLFVLVAWWSATHRIDRFWYPVIPLVALLTGAGGAWMARQVSSRAAAALVLTSLCAVTAQCLTSHPLWSVYGWRLFALDLTEARGTFTKPVVAYLNRELPPDAVVLVVGEAAVFDFRRKVFYCTAFNARMFDRWLAEGNGSELARLGITHVYVDWSEIARYRSAGNYGFTDTVVPELFDDLVRRGVLGRPNVWTYELESLPPASRRVFQQWGSLRVTRPGSHALALVYALYAVRRPLPTHQASNEAAARGRSRKLHPLFNRRRLESMQRQPTAGSSPLGRVEGQGAG